ncbi:hypothetical protein ABZW11_39075 [Nonomuraea sp. NPDC004580]|uniref:hypothetical protein n=1 Tax=Nonomuraea sp. NPDC004580 TaxID=3154552 RepID=UPI0033B830A4
MQVVEEYRRVHAAWPAAASMLGRTVRALMREQGLIPAQVRAFRPATTVARDLTESFHAHR